MNPLRQNQITDMIRDFSVLALCIKERDNAFLSLKAETSSRLQGDTQSQNV